MKRALVLSGGGSRGSYQIGVWKALRKLNIKIDIVTGCSIGSINAAVIAQNKYFLAKRMWLKLTTDDLFEPRDRKILKNVGMKFDKSEEFLRRVISEQKLRKSKIDYGLVTYNLNKKSPKFLTKDQIPNGKLIDYIIASCTCYPFVETKKIDDEYYIDGGFYDNMPINLAIEMGADEVIAVDLNTIGVTKKVKEKDVDIIIIKNQYKGFDILDFTKEKAKIRIKLGYNDTMKTFNKLDGNNYTFKKGHLEKNYNNVSSYYIDLLKVILFNDNKSIIKELFKVARYNNLFTNIKQNKDVRQTILDSLEYLGELFELDDTKIYNIDKYNKLLIKKVKELSYIKISKNLKGKMLIGYIYNKYMEEENKEKVYKELFNLSLIFQKDFLAALYLISISKRYPLTLKTEEFYQEIYQMLNKDD